MLGYKWKEGERERKKKLVSFHLSRKGEEIENENGLRVSELR